VFILSPDTAACQSCRYEFGGAASLFLPLALSEERVFCVDHCNSNLKEPVCSLLIDLDLYTNFEQNFEPLEMHLSRFLRATIGACQPM
jgi:hypothetical protein